MTFDRISPARGFLTPPPSTWKTRLPLQSPSTPLSSESKRSSPVSCNKGDIFHIVHKVPSGDSPYVKAKQVQLVDKDPGKAISLFWRAINAGDRVESALKDMALVMKQMNRSDEAIEAIKSFRHLCPSDSQESLDNILVELYKRSGRIDEEIEMLQHKLKKIEDGVTFVGRRTKQARSQGKKIHITVEQEISRILGNLAWAYLQKGDYRCAEEQYRKALSFEPDRNKQCNLAICLMQMNNITEAKFLLQAVSAAYKNRKIDDSFAKSYERAFQMLTEIEEKSQQAVDKERRESVGQNSTDEKQKKGSNKSGLVKSRKDKWSVTSEVEVKIPQTEPRRCPWGFNNGGGNQRRELWGDSNSDPNSNKSLFGGRPASSALVKSEPNRKILEKVVKHDNDAKESVGSSVVGTNLAVDKSLVGIYGNSSSSVKKSWADIAEEEEEKELLFSGRGGYSCFDDNEEAVNDENWNSNIIYQKDESDDEFESGNAILLRNPTVRRSLCFNPVSRDFLGSSKSPTKASKSESQRIIRRNRLQVFQDITLHPGTP